ncbi:hypothetical protein BDAP_001379 [Binucleata daphniae]
MGIKLLHNFFEISTEIKEKKSKKQMYISYNILSEEKLHKNKKITLKKVKTNMLKYYKKNDFNNNSKIFKNENYRKIKKYVIKKLSIIYKKKGEQIFEKLYNTIAKKRGLDTKINYIAKSSYYENKEQGMGVSAENCNFQKKFLKELNKVKEKKMEYGMNFDALQMHTQFNILSICALSSELDEKIKCLIGFTKQYDEISTSSIKEKLKKTIEKCCNDLLLKSEDSHTQPKIEIQTCIEIIDEIKSPSQNSENTHTATEIEQYYSTYYEQYINEAFELITNYLKLSKFGRINIIKKIDDVKERTKNVICEYYKSNFYNNVGNITELQKKIVDDLENTKDDENNTLKTIINNKNIVNILQLQSNNLLKISTQEQNKEVGETNKTEVSTSELAENKDIEKFFEKNKQSITTYDKYDEVEKPDN